jgi:signal transduction histidine kinase
MRTGGIEVPEVENLEEARLRIKELQEEIKKLLGLLNEQESAAKLLVQKDIALTRANEKLERLDRAKSEFVSVAAHQLRTPLSGIKWGLNILFEGDAGDMSEEQRSIIKKSAESNDRMIALVNDLLDVDHIETEKDRYTFEAVDICEIIESIFSELKPRAEEQGTTLAFENRFAKYAKVRADKVKIRAVIQNLLENAVRYIMKDGTVTVRLKQEGEMMNVSVTDDGIGIPADEQEKIFTKFFRADNAVKLRTDGSGLGLFIAHDIVRKHKGEIWFESEKDKGTVFAFTVPVAK